MSKPRRKRVLFIAWFFPPSGGAGVQRTARYVKYLRDYGYEPIVVAPYADTYRRDPLSLGEDRSFMAEIPRDVKVHRVSACQPFALLRLLKKLKLLWLWSFFIRPDEKLTWALAAVPAAVKIARQEKVDIICQNLGPWSSSLVGLMVKSLTGKPLVYDIRDPWTQWAMGGWPTPLHYAVERRLERWVLSRADGIAMLGDTYRAELLRAHPSLDPHRVVVIPNGFDQSVPPPETAPRDDGPFRIVHAGKFYDTWGRSGKRTPLAAALNLGYDATLGLLRYSPRKLDNSIAGPRYLIEGLARLAKRDPELASKVRLEFMGRVHPQVRRQAESLGLSEQVHLPGPVPHDECVREMARADLLFLPLFRWADGSPMGVLPLKLYEYMATGRPILCAASEGDMKETLRRAGTAFFVEPDNPDSFARCIEEAVRQREQGLRAKPDWDYIASFHRRALTGRLAKLMDDVLAERARNYQRASALPSYARTI
jgi:glycosyltransferase involved in cell wall biosynthesis